MVTASRNNPRHLITRNTSFFKRLKTEGNNNKLDEMEGDDEIAENNDVDRDQVERNTEHNAEQQLEGEAPEEPLQYEQERIEQGNEVQEQLVIRGRQREEVDAD